MIFFGHVGTVLFLAALLSLQFVFVFIGVILPDVIDKFFYIVGVFPCGRFIGHTIWFAPALALVTYVVTRKKIAAVSTLFGSYLHLVGDVEHLLPLFMPFVSYKFDCTMPLSEGVDISYIILEVVGIILLIAAVLYHKKLSAIGSKLIKKLKRI